MKYALLLLTSLAATGAAHAQVKSLPSASDYSEGQSTTSRNTGFGIKGGLSWSNLQDANSGLFFSPFEDLKTFHAGIYGQYGLTHFASLQVELLYSRKGFRGSASNLPAGSTLPENRFDYLELPVLFVGNITETLSIHLGPQVSLLTRAQTDGQLLNLSQSSQRRFDVGGILGAEARIGPGRLGVGYDLSLASFNYTGAAITYNGQPIQVLATDNNYRNAVLQVYLGIGFAH